MRTLESQPGGCSASGVLKPAGLLSAAPLPHTFGVSLQMGCGSQEPPGAGVGGKGHQAVARTPGFGSYLPLSSCGSGLVPSSL